MQRHRIIQGLQTIPITLVDVYRDTGIIQGLQIVAITLMDIYRDTGKRR